MCTICVLVSWGRWALTQHLGGSCSHPDHTVTRLAHVRVHTHSLRCAQCCMHTFRCPAPTHSDMLRNILLTHSVRIPHTLKQNSTHMLGHNHTQVFSRLEHDHALKHYHTLTSLHSHAPVCFILSHVGILLTNIASKHYHSLVFAHYCTHILICPWALPDHTPYTLSCPWELLHTLETHTPTQIKHLHTQTHIMSCTLTQRNGHATHVPPPSHP